MDVGSDTGQEEQGQLFGAYGDGGGYGYGAGGAGGYGAGGGGGGVGFDVVVEVVDDEVCD